MKRTYEEWLKYYKNTTKEQVIEDMTHDFEEIEKLNNIINELEKYIRSYIDLLVENPDMIEQGQLDILYEVLDKIKELKEGKRSEK